MADEKEQAYTGNFAGFRIDRGPDWVKFSADLGELGRKIGDEVRKAMASIDFDGICNNLEQSMRSMAEEMQAATADWGDATRWKGPMHVQVDLRTSQEAQESVEPQPDERSAERMTVLNLVADGKISAEEGAKLLEALG